MKTTSLKYTLSLLSILFIATQTPLKAQLPIKQEALNKIAGNWMVIKKHKSKYKGDHKVSSETTDYAHSATDKITYTFAAPNKLTITETENKNGKQEIEIDHYEIKKLDNTNIEMIKLNDDDLIKDSVQASWEINSKNQLMLKFKKKKTFSKTIRERTLILEKEAN